MSKSSIFTLTLVKVPGSTSTVNLQEPVTIAQAIEADGGNPAEWKAQINGVEVPMDTQVNEYTGTVRLLKSKVKGN